MPDNKKEQVCDLTIDSLYEALNKMEELKKDSGPMVVNSKELYVMSQELFNKKEKICQQTKKF